MQNGVSQLPFDFHIGTIGFSYPEWAGVFYPSTVRKEEWLSTYATAFEAVELDTTFYGAPPPERTKKWADAVPAGFEFCPKTPRAITHAAPLAEGFRVMEAFNRGLQPMVDAGELGPVLIQFPPSFGCAQHGELERFLAALPRDRRYAVELRHRSWQRPQTADLLSAYGCAWVAADYSTKAVFPAVTTDFVYLRFVGQHNFFPTHDRELIDPTERLEWWLAHLRDAAPAMQAGTKIYCLFTNDFAGYSPATANRFRKMLGLVPRLPPVIESSSPTQGSLF
jgi:uncharacterized protein YecE (DUF72 family)